MQYLRTCTWYRPGICTRPAVLCTSQTHANLGAGYVPRHRLAPMVDFHLNPEHHTHFLSVPRRPYPCFLKKKRYISFTSPIPLFAPPTGQDVRVAASRRRASIRQRPKGSRSRPTTGPNMSTYCLDRAIERYESSSIQSLPSSFITRSTVHA